MTVRGAHILTTYALSLFGTLPPTLFLFSWLSYKAAFSRSNSRENRRSVQQQTLRSSAASHALITLRPGARQNWRTRTPAGCTQNPGPCQTGTEPEIAVRLVSRLLRDGASTNQNQIEVLQLFFDCLCFSVSKSGHHVGPRRRDLAKHLSLLHGGRRAALPVRRIL